MREEEFMKTNQLEVIILSLVYGGEAMGRLEDGRAVFVPCALPGERVRVRLTEQKRSFARAELLEVIQASPDRVKPDCAFAVKCGGCHYLHMNYPAQLRAKEDIIRNQFQRIAGIAYPPVEKVIASPQELHYRNSIQFHLDPSGRLGFQAPGSHKLAPVSDCLLCAPAINEILPSLDFEGSSGLERVQVRVGVNDDALIVLESKDPVPPDFSLDLPISVVFVGPGGFEENEPLVLAGDDYLVMEASQRDFRVSAGSFFQVNIPQAENMIRYLLDHLPLSPTAHVLEVYAGVGLFSAFLAPRVAHLTAVEMSSSAIDDFAFNLDEFDNVDLFAGAAEDVLRGLDQKSDTILVDPPRSGLALPALDAILQMEAPFLAYVSCDPSTLARDVKRLQAGGYQLQRVQPFDMFPQTYHVETVALLSK